jgi:hypothetical protein
VLAARASPPAVLESRNDGQVPAITDPRLLQRAASYLDAALNKVEVASYCQSRLAAVLESGEALRVEVQAYFEGMLYAGVAAIDQIAEVVNRAFALELNKPNLRASLEALRTRRLERETADLVTALDRWRRKPIVREAGAVRWRATHHYYPKEPRAGAWFYEASDGIDLEEGGSVGLLAEAYVRELQTLRDLIWRLASAVGADRALTDLRDGR